MKTNHNRLAQLSVNPSKNNKLSKSILSVAIVLAISSSAYADDKTAECKADANGNVICTPTLQTIYTSYSLLAPPLDSNGDTKSATGNTVTQLSHLRLTNNTLI